MVLIVNLIRELLRNPFLKAEEHCCFTEIKFNHRINTDSQVLLGLPPLFVSHPCPCQVAFKMKYSLTYLLCLSYPCQVALGIIYIMLIRLNDNGFRINLVI